MDGKYPVRQVDYPVRGLVGADAMPGMIPELWLAKLADPDCFSKQHLSPAGSYDRSRPGLRVPVNTAAVRRNASRSAFKRVVRQAGVFSAALLMAITTSYSGRSYVAPELDMPSAGRSGMIAPDPCQKTSYEPEPASDLVVVSREDSLKNPSARRGRASLESVLESKDDDFFRGIGSGSEYLFVVDKDEQKARVYRVKMELVDETIVSTGLNPGDKEREGDMRTPNGVFSVVSVENSTNWIHNGAQGVYGPYFARFNAGSWDKNGVYDPGGRSSLGAHTTNETEYLGQRKSEGCPRFPRDKIIKYVRSGMLRRGAAIAIIGD
ncbi:L,D-transpeptidase [Candidatus Woesearchaeota archaeon]|nr:L,D-transpeptidase [Candidatus Woesearchaeota archaeon]